MAGRLFSVPETFLQAHQARHKGGQIRLQRFGSDEGIGMVVHSVVERHRQSKGLSHTGSQGWSGHKQTPFKISEECGVKSAEFHLVRSAELGMRSFFAG